jgi:hypothetical protein
LLLLAVATVYGIRIRLDDLATLADVRPQSGIVEVTSMSLTHGVIQVLYVGEHRDSSHPNSSMR